MVAIIVATIAPEPIPEIILAINIVFKSGA